MKTRFLKGLLIGFILITAIGLISSTGFAQLTFGLTWFQTGVGSPFWASTI